MGGTRARTSRRRRPPSSRRWPPRATGSTPRRVRPRRPCWPHGRTAAPRRRPHRGRARRRDRQWQVQPVQRPVGDGDRRRRCAAAADRPADGVRLGRGGAGPLLDWLEVPEGRRVVRESVLDADRQAALRGLVLLDLPDHDSTAVATGSRSTGSSSSSTCSSGWSTRRSTPTRPCTAATCDRLVGHDEVMLVVLNQVDRLADGEVETCSKDLRRLLDADGLEHVPVVTTSARRGDGVDELRELLADVVQGQSAFLARATADLDEAARRSPAVSPAASRTRGPCPPPRAWWRRWPRPPACRCCSTPSPRSTGGRRRGRSAGCWALVAVPGRRLPAPAGSRRPDRGPAARAHQGLALDALAGAARAGRPRRPRGGERGRGRAAAAMGRIGPDGDHAARRRARGSARPGRQRGRPDGAAGMVVVGAAGPAVPARAATVVGLLWLTVLGVLRWTGQPRPSTPYLGPVPLPSLLFFGGLLAGGRSGCSAHGSCAAAPGDGAAEAVEALRTAVAQVAWERVVAPVARVLDDHRTAREAIAAAF